MALAAVVGIIAGLGAICFDSMLGWTLRSVAGSVTGYAEPAPGSIPPPIFGEAGRSLRFLFLPAIGGLISGLIVYGLAPEAEGHGTDAMIESFHLRGGRIRNRVPLVKIVASVITIGTGGSAGKEGPIAQIGSGFGSGFAGALQPNAKEQRLLLLAGAAGGIGAIFQAPLGAALFVPEVLYRDTEFEFEAILPCVISSIIAYSIYTGLYGGGAIFFPGTVDSPLPTELPFYALFGAACAAAGWFYIRTFYGARNWFARSLPLPRMLKPAFGGLLLGLVAWRFPQVTSGGYGWVQMALEGKVIWWAMLLLVLHKVVATSLTIGSGGSGGVFGPSVFIGGMLGGAFGHLAQSVAPEWVVHPKSFVLVGLGAFFAVVAKTPIASIIMACEMCSSYTLLVPLMISSSVGFLLLRKSSLYEKQQVNRIASPAHISEFSRGMLGKIRVSEAIRPMEVETIPESMPFGELLRIVTRSDASHFPVVDASGTMTGVLSINDIRAVLFEADDSTPILARDAATPSVVTVRPEDSLLEALEKMSAISVDELPVERGDRPGEVIGMISKRDIVDFYYRKSVSDARRS